MFSLEHGVEKGACLISACEIFVDTLARPGTETGVLLSVVEHCSTLASWWMVCGTTLNEPALCLCVARGQLHGQYVMAVVHMKYAETVQVKQDSASHILYI